MKGQTEGRTDISSILNNQPPAAFNATTATTTYSNSYNFNNLFAAISILNFFLQLAGCNSKIIDVKQKKS